LWNVVYNTVMHFINTVFLFYILKTIAKKEQSRNEKWGFIVISTIIISVLYNTLYKKISFSTVNTLISTVLYVVLSSLVLKNKLYQSVIGVSILYILAGIGEAISYLVFVQRMGLTPQYITETIGMNILLHVINYMVILIFLAVPTIQRVIKDRKNNNNYDSLPNYRKQAVIAIIVTLIIISVGTYNWFHNKLTGRDLVIMNALLTLVFLMSSITYILTIQKALKKNEENKKLKTYIMVTQELSEELRRFKHNYRNLLYGLGGYIENKDWESLKTYYDDLLHASTEVSSSDIYSMRNIKNNALFGLISQKIRSIKDLSQNIGIQILVPEEVETFPIKECDICEVVGAYLDNAIEAASQAKDKRVVFEMFRDDGSLNIVVKNTFDNSPDLSKIFDRGYTTKKEQGKGLGLCFAKNILNKYDNVLYNTYINGDLFVQEIIMHG
jgi:two-component system sensor histidine kinase AgrC